MATNIKLNNPLSDAYLGLPAVTTNYLENQFNPKDKVLPDPKTGSILIIGSAIDGPVGEPISVRELGGTKSAIEMFGGVTDKVQIEERGKVRYVDVPNNNSLSRALLEADARGADDIRLLRVDGKSALTELAVSDPEGYVNQPLADNIGSNIMNGNIRFVVPVEMKEAERFLNVIKIEELDKDGTIVQTKEGKEGYKEVVEGFDNNVEIYINENTYAPGNTLRVTYKVASRNYIEVAHTDEDGLLTQDTTNSRYFAGAHQNWSDDPSHTINLYLVEKGGAEDGGDKAVAIPSMMEGKYIYRPGDGTTPVSDPLTSYPTDEEFLQGGISFTTEFDKYVAEGMFPSLSTANLVAMADYTRYESVVVEAETKEEVKGQQKSRQLRSTPDMDTLVVYYILGDKEVEIPEEGYTLQIGSSSNDKNYVIVKSGAAPVGAKLYAKYEPIGGGESVDSMLVMSKYPGKVYSQLRIPEDKTSIEGVSISVELPVLRDGKVVEDGRLIRIKKPKAKMKNSLDTELVYSTVELSELRTLRQMANFINNDTRNNVVKLVVPEEGAGLLVTDLDLTPFEADGLTGERDYQDVHLGFELNEVTGRYELKEDENFDLYDPRRFPWLGNDGIYDNTDMEQMLHYYNRLGGIYGWDYDRSTEEMVLLEPGIYTDLENYPVEHIQLVDVYANTAIGQINDFGEVTLDREKNFATQLAQFAATLSARTDIALGFIAMAPLAGTTLREVQESLDLHAGGRTPDEELEERYVKRGINPYFKNEHNLYNPMTGEEIFNEQQNPIDIGYFLSVVFGPEVGMSMTGIGNYYSSGLTVLTSLVAGLPVNVSTTNHKVSILGMRYRFSLPQLEQLTNAGYVTFNLDNDLQGRKNYIVVDGVTAGEFNSDYRRLSTIRITHLVVHYLRLASKPYIGKSGGIAMENSLSTDIKAALEQLKTAGVITNYDFDMEVSKMEQFVKNIYIDLNITPVYEIRRIRTTVTVVDDLT